MAGYWPTVSEKNAELVRRVYDLLNEGGVDAALELAADDCVWDWSNSIGPAKGIYRGKEQVREFSASFVEAFDEVLWDPVEIVEVDDSRVIVVNHIRMRGRGSGVEVEAVGAQLWTITDRRVSSVKLFQSKAGALEAVGLR
jgi:ketosteroid isomerase-like protein